MNRNLWLGSILVFVWLGALLSCGKSPSGTTCTAGQQETCFCASGAAGVETCLSDGSGFGSCVCATPDSGTPTDSGVGGNDAGGTNDSGTPPNDAGSGNDAGPGNDAGNPTDAGTPTDAGSPADAGGGSDAGQATDSGTTDAGHCGDGIINANEQCDDGNLLDLDGCDSTCHYEMITRMTSLQISGSAAPAFCIPTTNAFGTQVIANANVLAQLNTPLDTDISNGTIDILTQFVGLTDLTGVSSSGPLSLGLYQAAPDPAKGAFDAGNPEDWWFLVSPDGVSNGLPTDLFTNGSLSGGALSFGPSSLSLTLTLAGTPATLQMLEARMQANISQTPAPNVPAPPPTNLDAGLVFQTIAASGAGLGLCGNVTVASLAQIPIPQLLTAGIGACYNCVGSSFTYTYCGAGNPVGPGCNSLLDAIVGGCKVLSCFAPAINPSQPDVPSGTSVQMLTLDPTTHKVTQPTSNDTDAYSSYFTFDQNRAHATGEACTQPSQCQAGQTCTGGVCK